MDKSSDEYFEIFTSGPVMLVPDYHCIGERIVDVRVSGQAFNLLVVGVFGQWEFYRVG